MKNKEYENVVVCTEAALKEILKIRRSKIDSFSASKIKETIRNLNNLNAHAKEWLS